MNTVELRKSKIEFFDSNSNKIKLEHIENLLKREDLSLDEKWFLRGCKQIIERHYTESIKRFQLSSALDSKIMIIAVSFKIADSFLLNEYIKTDLTGNFKYFPKFKFYPFFVKEEKKVPIDINFIKNLANF